MLAKSNLKTSLSHIWVICELLPFVSVGQSSGHTFAMVAPSRKSQSRKSHVIIIVGWLFCHLLFPPFCLTILLYIQLPWIYKFLFVCFLPSRCIPCHFLDVANTVLEITDFCSKLRLLSILITDFSFQRLAALYVRHFATVSALGTWLSRGSYGVHVVVIWGLCPALLIPRNRLAWLLRDIYVKV